MLCHNSFFENSPELLMSLELGGGELFEDEMKENNSSVVFVLVFVWVCFYENQLGCVLMVVMDELFVYEKRGCKHESTAWNWL